MARRIVSAREQVELLSPWRTASGEAAPPSIHDIMPGRFSDGNGRWDYRHQETSGDSYPRHEYGIHPVSSPTSHTFTNEYGKTYTVHYDPALTRGQTPRPGKFGHEWDDHEALRNEVSDLKPPPGMLWRGMSREEYEKSRDRGYFESEGGHNFDSQQGLTYFSTNPEQAGNYATWFAPADYKPTFTHPGYVVGIPDRPDAPRGGDPRRPDPTSTEVGLPGRVPFSEATHHYVGRPSTIRPGMQGVSEGWHGWEESGGAHPSSTIMWSQMHPGHHTAARLAERADRFEWQRGPDGGWELATSTPDGNRVTIKTSPVRGQYTTAARPDRSLEQHLRDTYEPYPPNSPSLPEDLRPHLMLPTEIAHHYREYDRPDDENTQMLRRVIGDQGIRQPLKISTDGTYAILHEGNHRVNVARQLGMSHVPVQVHLEKPGEVMTNSEGSRPVLLEPVLGDWVQQNRQHLKSFWS